VTILAEPVSGVTVIVEVKVSGDVLPDGLGLDARFAGNEGLIRR
jgi:hypothetical protein